MKQALWLLSERGVKTLCVHGDNPKALEFVRALRAELLSSRISIRKWSVECSS